MATSGVLPETFVDGWHDPDVVKRMPYAKFGKTSRLVSKLSLGCSSFGNAYGVLGSSFKEEDCHAVVQDAIKAGVNLLDTAPWYGHGQSELVLGRALKPVPRGAYYISTKVCRYFPGTLEQFDFTYERTYASVLESLARLQLDYIDVVQVHDPEFAPSLDLVLAEVLPALQKLKEEGKIRFIGITGYPVSALTYLAQHCPPGIDIDSCLSYCRYNMHDDSLVTSGCLKTLTDLNIGVINGSPYSMGLLLARGPPAWHPSSAALKARCAAAAAKATSMGLDIAHLAFAHCMAQPDIATTMTSTTSPKRLLADIEAARGEHDIGPEGWAAIRAIQEEFFSGPGYAEIQHWEGLEVAKYWRKVGQALSKAWYTERLAAAGRPMAPLADGEGPAGITAAHAVRAPALYHA